MKQDPTFLDRLPSVYFSRVDPAALIALIATPNAEMTAAAALSKLRDEAYKPTYRATTDSIRRLVGKMRIQSPKAGEMGNTPPSDDHGRLFVKDGVPEFYLSQPYGLSHSQLVEILAWCDKFGLTVSISATASNWCPGSTIGLIYERKKDEKR
jgi:hypothetical protein